MRVISLILSGEVETVDRAQWERLLTVIERLALTGSSRRIVVTADMKESFSKKIKAASITSGKLAKLVNGNGTESSVVITSRAIDGLLRKTKTIVAIQWDKINHTLDNLIVTAKSQEPDDFAVKNDSAPKSIDDLIAEKLADSLSGLTDNLVARVADAVFARLNINLATPPEGKPGPRRRKSRKSDDYAALAPVAETVIAPVSPQVFEATVASTPERIQAYNFPLFNKQDARGDSMLSCLHFAERAAEIGDHVGAKSNLRKFVEAAIHATLLNITAEQFVGTLDLKANDVDELLGIGRRYGHMCAEATDSKTLQRNGATAKSARIEVADRLQLLSEAMKVLRKVDRIRFPSNITEAAHSIVVAAGDIHHQLRHKETRPVASVLDNGFYLADWMKREFAFPRPPIVQAQPKLQALEPVAEHKTAQPKLSSSILKVLDIKDIDLSHADADTALYVAELATHWAQEPAVIKAQNNRSIQHAYEAVKPGIEAMLAVGATVSQMAVELNKQAPASFEWNAETILRGAVLTLDKLPLSAFEIKPSRSVSLLKKPMVPTQG